MRLVEEVDLLLEMTSAEALTVLGLSGFPAKAEVQKSWKKLAFKHHPDRGGDIEKMKAINQARDTLLTPGTRPGRRYSPPDPREAAPPAPKPPSPGGESTFKAAWTKLPRNVEWLFQTGWVQPSSEGVSSPIPHEKMVTGAVLYGRSKTHHVIVGISRRTHRTQGNFTRDLRRQTREATGYHVIVMPTPLRIDIRKAGLKSIKALAGSIGISLHRRLQFKVWAGKVAELAVFEPRGKAYFFDDIIDLVDPQGAPKRRKKAVVANHDYVEGDIFVSSWGYDQTNVNFYQVVGISKASVKVRKIDLKVARSERGADYVVAEKGHFMGSQMTKRVRPDGSIKIASYESARRWDGSPQYQTGWGFGH